MFPVPCSDPVPSDLAAHPMDFQIAADMKDPCGKITAAAQKFRIASCGCCNLICYANQHAGASVIQISLICLPVLFNFLRKPFPKLGCGLHVSANNAAMQKFSDIDCLRVSERQIPAETDLQLENSAATCTSSGGLFSGIS